MANELREDTVSTVSVNLDSSREFLEGFPVAMLPTDVKGCVGNVVAALAEVAKLPQLIEGRSPIPGEYGWAYALQNGTVVISDSKQDENNYSGSLGPLECKFSVTFPFGRDSYRREVYKTRPDAIILMMKKSLTTREVMVR